MNQYKIKNIKNYQEWLQFFLLINKPNLPQSWSYCEAKVSSHGWKIVRAVITENENPIALIQAWYKKILFFKLVRISYGPLWIIKNPSFEQIKNIFLTIKKKFCLKKLIALSIAPNLENSPENKKILADLFFLKRKTLSYESGLVDLTQSVSDLRIKLRQNWRNQLNLSEKKSLAFKISQNSDDFQWIITCFETLRKEKNFYGHSVKLLNALFHCRFRCQKSLVGIVSQNNE